MSDPLTRNAHYATTSGAGHFGHKTLRHQDTLGHFGTTKLVLKFKTNHRWSCVSSELSWVEVSRLFLDHMALVSKCLVPRFWCRSVLRPVPKCPRVSWCRSVLWPKCPVTRTSCVLARCCCDAARKAHLYSDRCNSIAAAAADGAAITQCTD